MSRALEGQVVFITGAGSGLGEAAAKRLAEDGAIIVATDIDGNKAARVADVLGGLHYAFDVCDAGAFDAAVDDCVTRLGRLDVMVNNAGIAPKDVSSKTDRQIANAMRRVENRLDEWEPMNYLVDLGDDAWDQMLKIHLYGSFHGCRAALRHMQPAKQGRIINISSVLGLRPSAGAPHYSVAKAGIIALTKSVADEVAPLGINVNAICPGYIDTPLLTPFSEMLKAAIVTRIGKGRMGRPEELAEMVRFLAGPESSYCTGDVFSVSGGYMG